MSRYLCVVSVIFAAVAVSMPSANAIQGNSKTFTPPGAISPDPYTEFFFIPVGVASATIECWGPAGNSISVADPPGTVYGGTGGGAYASSVLKIAPGDNRKMKIEIWIGWAACYGNNTNTPHVRAAAGGSPPATNLRAGGAGGQAANSIGQVKFSGGNGGALFAGVLNGKEVYYGGGGGGGAGPMGAGANGASATAAGPGLGGAGFSQGGNGQIEMVTGRGAQPGGGCGGPNFPATGGMGMVKISW